MHQFGASKIRQKVKFSPIVVLELAIPTQIHLIAVMNNNSTNLNLIVATRSWEVNCDQLTNKTTFTSHDTAALHRIS